MTVSICGLVCDECPTFGAQCAGCRGVKGRTFWALEMMPNQVCALYECAISARGLHDCGDCAELPCPRFVELKDPSATEEQHQAALAKRVAVLKKRA